MNKKISTFFLVNVDIKMLIYLVFTIQVFDRLREFRYRFRVHTV
jgi:hypothetical protein